MEGDNRSLAALIERCNRGERRAWEDFYSRYHPLVQRVVSRYGSQRHGDVEDMIQEVFLSLFKALRQYDPARPLEAYILEIARRVRISTYRRQASVKRGGTRGGSVPLEAHDASEGGYISIASSDDDQESQLGDRQEARLLRAALANLSETCRRLLALRYDEGLSYKDIAAASGEKEGTLRVKVQRCVASLGRKFSELTADGVRSR